MAVAAGCSSLLILSTKILKSANHVLSKIQKYIHLTRVIFDSKFPYNLKKKRKKKKKIKRKIQLPNPTVPPPRPSTPRLRLLLSASFCTTSAIPPFFSLYSQRWRLIYSAFLSLLAPLLPATGTFYSDLIVTLSPLSLAARECVSLPPEQFVGIVAL